MVTETKVVELVIVADHSEVSVLALCVLPQHLPTLPHFTVTCFDPQVRRYPDFQHLLNRTLEVALLLDTVSVWLGSILTAPLTMANPILSSTSLSVFPAPECTGGASRPGGLDPA